MAAEGSEISRAHQVDSALRTEPVSARAEIDTSAPFESVKEAANRFGGMGFWRPTCHKASENASEHASETVDVIKVEEQAAELERDLILKERETLDVLKELEATKNVVEQLKLKLQKEASEVNVVLKENAPKDNNANCVAQEPDEGALDSIPSASPGLILLELKQAKVNITRTTHDLADIRATVDAYKKRIEKERLALEKTRQRLISSASKTCSLEEELNQTRQKLELVKETKDQDVYRDPSTITSELHKLSAEAEQFKMVGEAARNEVVRTMTEIEQTKTRIHTAEIRLLAAEKMKEAAKASEAVALAEIRAISKSVNKPHAPLQKSEAVTLTFEEYSSLVSKAREAEKACRDRVGEAMSKVDEANISKTEILRKVGEATEEVKINKKALEEALSRVEAANKGKLAVEEALRMWRSEHRHKRRSVHNSTKFKNPHPSAHRKESGLLDVNGLHLAHDELKSVLKPTLSIGQILSRKLLLTEDYETGLKTEKSIGKRKVSLAQMLSRPDKHSAEKYGKENNELPAKRKKFGFARITLLVTKQSKKKKKQIATSLCRSRSA